MIEKTIRTYLIEKLSTNSVYLETPKTVSGEFIVFRIIDRGRTNYINAATVELYSYADSKLKAAELNDDVINAMLNFIELDDISKSELGGGSDDFDTSLKKYRYRAYFNIYY